MNTTPTNINSANAIQAQAPAGKQQDAATPDVPFSQVLSREIAQNRKSSGSQQDTDTQAGPESASQAGRPAETDADATAQATPDETSAIDALALPFADAATTPGVQLAVADASTMPAVQLAVADAATTPGVPLADAPTLPEAMLALPINPDPLRPIPVRTDGVDAQQAPGLAANTLPFQTARQGRMPPGEKAGQAAGPARGTGKAEPALPGKATLQTATATATAKTFPEQLTAARQSDATKTGEFLSDLMSNPAMRPTSHAPLQTLPASNEMGSPKLAPMVGTSAWGQAVGEKIVWMATAAQQTATLTLNPPDMGPLQIVLNVSNEQATASFFSAQPEVRQALEAAFPRLREMMNEAGIQLGQATVSADTSQQNNTPERQAQRTTMPFPGADEAATAELSALHAPVRQSGRGLIDTFA